MVIIISMLYQILRILDFTALTLAIIIAAGGDSPRLTGDPDRVRSFTREIEFDYPNWVFHATWIKAEQNAIGLPHLFDRATNKEIVFEYLRATHQLIQTEIQIEQVFANP